MYTTAALESAFDNLTKLSYVSTSPAGAAIGGIDSKPQVLEGAPLLKEDQLRKPSEMDEFYTQYTQGPRLGSAYEALEKMAAFTGNEKEQFGTFLKRVMAEVAATFIAAYKVTNTPPLNKFPGTGTLRPRPSGAGAEPEHEHLQHREQRQPGEAPCRKAHRQRTSRRPSTTLGHRRRCGAAALAADLSMKSSAVPRA